MDGDHTFVRNFHDYCSFELGVATETDARGAEIL